MKGVFLVAFFASILELLDSRMDTPQLYGVFHLLWLIGSFGAAVAFTMWHRRHPAASQRKVILITSITVIIFEIYKQINYSFSYTDGITFDYQWYAFPMQFCSTPMYVGLLAGLTKKGKLHNALCAYMATFSLFAGMAVMFYPGDVFTQTIGINIQTMVCHGSMIFLGVYLLATGYVRLEHKTVLKAVPVFSFFVILAMILNEIAYQSGLLETEEFNMFFISPYCAPHLPVYSLVQGVVPFPWCLLIYIAGFTLAAYAVLLIAMGVRTLAVKIAKQPVHA